MLHVQAGVAEHLMVMLESSSAEVRSVAAACLGDLAAAHPPLQLYLTQVSPHSPLLVLLSCGCSVLASVMLLALDDGFCTDMLLALDDGFCTDHLAAFVPHAAPTVVANLPCPARHHEEFVLVLLYRG